MALWLCTKKIMPMISYWAVAWWKKSCRWEHPSDFVIQRLAFLCLMEATRTVPTAALEVLLDLPPLYLQVQGEVRLVMHTLLQGQGPISKMHEGKVIWLCNKLQEDLFLGIPVDAMWPKYDYEKNVWVVLPHRKNWLNSPSIKANMVWWYTGGFKREQGSKAGIYSVIRWTKTSISLQTHAKVFQAKTKAMYITRKSFWGTQIKSKLNSHNKVTLDLVSDETEGHQGNEKICKTMLFIY